MRNKKQVVYVIQSNVIGGFDIVQNTSVYKVVGHTENEEAAKEVINILKFKNNDTNRHNV